MVCVDASRSICHIYLLVPFLYIQESQHLFTPALKATASQDKSLCNYCLGCQFTDIFGCLKMCLIGIMSVN